MYYLSNNKVIFKETLKTQIYKHLFNFKLDFFDTCMKYIFKNIIKNLHKIYIQYEINYRV